MRLRWCRSELILWKAGIQNCSCTAARAVLGSVGRCAASPALLPPPVRWGAGEGGSSLLHALSHLLREEGHLMETERLGHYLYEEWGLERKKVLLSLSVFG